MGSHLSQEEIELLKQEENRLSQAHRRYCKTIWLYGWIVPLGLCLITMLVSDADSLIIVLVWTGIGLVINIGLCVENMLGTKKQIAPIKKAIADNNRTGVEFLLRDLSAEIHKITQKDIEYIETQLGIVLPNFFISTIIDYPFPKGSLAEEFLLPPYTSVIIGNNGTALTEHIPVAPENMFIVGGDGGEELYYIDLNSTAGEVFSYSMETKTSRIYTESWDAYLNRIAVLISAE